MQCIEKNTNRLNATDKIVQLYDRLESLADSTAFYVDPAVNRMTKLGSLCSALRIVEVGGGTGRHAQRWLQCELPAGARYVDLEPSEQMRTLARRRLAAWSNRADVQGLDGLPDGWDGAADRYIATYVLNVLSSDDAIRERLQHAHRTLADTGLLCLVNQTFGRGAVERAVATLWMRLYRVVPAALGNCRLLSARPFLDAANWKIEHCELVCRFGFCSEVVVASKRV
ncbi:MAG TPA: class I SAM-dependent methyltransferase [Candidatus Baltobacteraceae bacterium]